MAILDRHRALFVSLLIVSACGGGATSATSTSAPTTSTTADTTTTRAALEPWVWGIDEVDLGGGYALAPCDGDADQIACIIKDDSVLGSAEHLPLPVESFDILEGVDDPVETIELIAVDYVATFLADRQTTCPHLEFRELAPTPVTIGTRPGLRYGFQESDGAVVVEKNLIYGVRQEQTIHLFSFSAIAEGACLSNEGELTDPALLDGLQPRLDAIMAAVESG